MTKLCFVSVKSRDREIRTFENTPRTVKKEITIIQTLGINLVGKKIGKSVIQERNEVTVKKIKFYETTMSFYRAL